jgi:RpiR family carbohydrate utilization transcriptional regulator
MPALSPAERKVAAVVVANPDFVMRATLLQVARQADVSEPTVLRLCRTLGFHSFNDFRIDLARRGAAEAAPPAAPRRIHAHDSIAAATNAVLQSTIATLQRLARAMPHADLERAAMAIVKARRVLIFGFGASAVVAADAQHKLFRLGVAAVAYSDGHLQAMAAAMLGPEDVMLAISQGGEPRDLIETTSVGLQGGATLVAVTRRDSSLAKAASLVIPVELEEEMQPWTPMVSRIAQLAAVDALIVGVARLAPPASTEILKRMRSAVEARRVRHARETTAWKQPRKQP